MRSIVRASGPWEYFCRKVNFTVPEKCWIWKGSCGTNGYGNWYYSLYDLPAAGTAHRRTYMLFHGFVSADAVICHSCNNKKCCNPGHLYLGTHQTNAQDRIKHGTATKPPLHKGTKQWNSKLTELDIVKIFTLLNAGMSPKDIAYRFGVSRNNIYKIKNGKNWKWLQS